VKEEMEEDKVALFLVLLRTVKPSVILITSLKTPQLQVIIGFGNFVWRHVTVTKIGVADYYNSRPVRYTMGCILSDSREQTSYFKYISHA